MRLRAAGLLNRRQKINLALLLLIPLLLFFVWGTFTEKARRCASELHAVIRADNVSAHINANRALYDMLKNANSRYTAKNILEGADAEKFAGYFDPPPRSR